ncbi:hypothetical protein EDD22DRAFT_964844 [Suillus occidentalis]|nr:hypothetical protein EDD22DRAFT_964844 [Suillus occidentalis]
MLVIDYRYHTRDCLCCLSESLLQFSSMGRRDKPSSPALRQCLATECWLAKPGIRDSQNAKARLCVACNRAKKIETQPPTVQKPSISSSPIPNSQSNPEELSFFSNRAKKMETQPPAAQKPFIPTSPIPDSQSDPEELSCDFPCNYDADGSVHDADGSVHEADGSVFYGANDSMHDMDDSACDTDDFVCYSADDSVLSMDNDLPCPCDTLTLQALETLVGQWWKEWVSESTWNDAYEDALGDARAEGGRAITTFLDGCAQHIWEGRVLLDGICDVTHTHTAHIAGSGSSMTVSYYMICLSVSCQR